MNGISREQRQQQHSEVTIATTIACSSSAPCPSPTSKMTDANEVGCRNDSFGTDKAFLPLYVSLYLLDRIFSGITDVSVLVVCRLEEVWENNTRVRPDAPQCTCRGLSQ